MAKKNPEVDAYIDKSAAFAQPILKKIRRLFHKGCPGAEEVIKWGVPHFEYQGMMGGMAAFKNHVSYGFWKAKLMSDPAGLFGGDTQASMCQKKITSVADLPPDETFIAYVKEAAALNDQGLRPTQPPRKPARKRAPPPYFAAALRRNKQAHATFEGFSAGHRNEYIEWITEAKRTETRDKRIAQAIEWLAEGKPRNWKYMKKC
jgi:uncharacterized protein YdeI (YjbR/CyaY-like superfamily)